MMGWTFVAQASGLASAVIVLFAVVLVVWG